jgi:hypothetical protein
VGLAPRWKDEKVDGPTSLPDPRCASHLTFVCFIYAMHTYMVLSQYSRSDSAMHGGPICTFPCFEWSIYNRVHLGRFLSSPLEPLTTGFTIPKDARFKDERVDGPTTLPDPR